MAPSQSLPIEQIEKVDYAIDLAYKLEGKIKVADDEYGITIQRGYHVDKPEEKVAIKVINPKNPGYTLHEGWVLMNLNGRQVPSVQLLYDMFRDETNTMYMILSKGIPLFPETIKNSSKTLPKKFTENEVATYGRLFLETIDDVHHYKVVHGNIQPSSYRLLNKKEGIQSCVLSNFDYAQFLPKDDPMSGLEPNAVLMSTINPNCMAPELLAGKENYNTKVDEWSIGCILYYMISGGQYPFGNATIDGVLPVKERILEYDGSNPDEILFNDNEIWDHVSNNVKEVIMNLLQPNVKTRWTAGKALQNQWIESGEFIRPMKQHIKTKDKLEYMVKRISQCKPNEPLDTKYILLDGDDNILDEGDFGTIQKAQLKSDTTQEFAIKIMDQSYEEEALSEILLMQKLNTVSNIAKLLDFRLDSDSYYLILPYNDNGDIRTVYDMLWSNGDDNDAVIYTEMEALKLMSSLLSTIQHMHKLNVVHRNLKLENMLLVDPNDKTKIMLSRFDNARELPTPDNDDEEEEGMTTFCGTSSYMAPEILNGETYYETVDCWSIGVCMFYILCGEMPFGDEDIDGIEEVYSLIGSGIYSYKSKANIWDTISENCKLLIDGLLTSNPKDRFTATKGLQCNWFPEQPKTEEEEEVAPEEEEEDDDEIIIEEEEEEEPVVVAEAKVEPEEEKVEVPVKEEVKPEPEEEEVAPEEPKTEEEEKEEKVVVETVESEVDDDEEEEEEEEVSIEKTEDTGVAPTTVSFDEQEESKNKENILPTKAPLSPIDKLRKIPKLNDHNEPIDQMLVRRLSERLNVPADEDEDNIKYDTIDKMLTRRLSDHGYVLTTNARPCSVSTSLKQYASFLGASGIAMGAFGAHMFQNTLQTNHTIDNWKTAVMYQLLNTTTILGISALARAKRSHIITTKTKTDNDSDDDDNDNNNDNLLRIGQILSLGTIMFSGSIYILSLIGGNGNDNTTMMMKQILDPITPIGGFVMIGGYVLLGLSE